MTDLRNAPRAFGRLVQRFAADTGGATAIEYAMIAAGIGAAIAAVVMSLGSNVKASYESVNKAF
jgi:pilus assembly protein Flp/PilA